MIRSSKSARHLVLSLLLSAMLGSLACAPAADPAVGDVATLASSFGTYTNPDSAGWDSWNRYSQYVPAKDGTRLAVDVFLPTRNGTEPEEPVPVVLHYTRYIRATEDEKGRARTRADADPILQHLLHHGYAVAAADARGTGASFGVHHGPFSVEETADSYTIIEWLGSQPWSNGRVGMAGRSYPGMTQYQAATQAPPVLKAIFPEMAGPSAYDFIFRGGAFKSDFVEVWGTMTRSQDLGELGIPARVDADQDGKLRDAAIDEHRANLWAQELIEPGSNLRNFTLDRKEGGHWSWHEVIATIDDADAIAATDIGIYHLVGWYDIYTTQQPWLYATLEGRSPQKMMIGPWVHSGGYGGKVHRAEILRWYDYWLKGIDNGVMDEPPVHYYVMQGNHTLPDGASKTEPTLDEAAAEDGSTWRPATDWPPAVERRKFWLASGRTGTVASSNDGALRPQAPSAAADAYSVDYSVEVGSFSRWMNGYGARREQPESSTYFDERTAQSEKSLTYTSEPLPADLTLVGYPTVHLAVTSSHSDGDFFVYLEEVDASGRSHYVSEGVLRASHRRTSEAPFDNLDLPFHRSYAEDLEGLTPGEPTELAFDLTGTAIVLDAGHRIRVTVAGADARNYAPFPDGGEADAPRIEILLGGENGSYVELPVVER